MPHTSIFSASGSKVYRKTLSLAKLPSTMSRLRIFFCMALALGTVKLALTFSAINKSNARTRHYEEKYSSRRKFLEKAALLSFGAGAAPAFSSPAFAEEEIVLPTKATVQAAFDLIKYELRSPEGGVSYMQGRINEQDFPGLMEFTKTYDQELRKLRMGKAKKLLQSKELKEQATSYANAVTFDLIGINRNSRKGQENVEGANKYLQELRDDITKFLSLEDSIQTEG